jgi:hypothetical protein
MTADDHLRAAIYHLERFVFRDYAHGDPPVGEDKEWMSLYEQSWAMARRRGTIDADGKWHVVEEARLAQGTI